jgi:tricarballylate dehydrogenase
MLKAYGFTDPMLLSAFSESVPDTIAWMKDYGIKFLDLSEFITTSTTRIAPSGAGEAVVEALATSAEKEGIPFHYETTARSLIENKKGEIRGVRTWSKAEGNIDLESKAVVLASGGYRGNLEMMVRYVGIHAYLTRPLGLGGMYCKGEGIEMALAIGAAAAGQYDNFHAMMVDPRSALTDAHVFIFNYGILVNQLGRRFIDEGYGLSDLTYAEITRQILRQPGGKAYLIYDSKIEDVPNYRVGIRSDKSPIQASSIKELASKLEIDPIRLETTVKDFNKAVQEGKFDPLKLDGKCTKGIEPPKSNWARTVEGPNLMAYPLICANVFTFGGVKITPRAEVLNRDGYAIPGLYAAGEMTGFYYGSDVGSTSFLRALVVGRKAGENAGQYCTKGY